MCFVYFTKCKAWLLSEGVVMNNFQIGDIVQLVNKTGIITNIYNNNLYIQWFCDGETTIHLSLNRKIKKVS